MSPKFNVSEEDLIERRTGVDPIRYAQEAMKAWQEAELLEVDVEFEKRRRGRDETVDEVSAVSVIEDEVG